jgi:hypothetical protein
VIITSAKYFATDTIHNNNWGRVGEPGEARGKGLGFRVRV